MKKSYYAFFILASLMINSCTKSSSSNLTSASISFSQVSGPVGTLVCISGKNLIDVKTVSIGGVPAIIISNTDSTIVAMVMPGAVSGPVKVVTSGASYSGRQNFTLTNSVLPETQQGGKLVGTGYIGIPVLQGISTAISADGNTVIVGAPCDNGFVGAAWVFTRSKGLWVQQGEKLVGTGYIEMPQQGRSVAISADGNTAVVGGSADNATVGATWIFTRNNGAWSQQGNKLVGTGYSGNPLEGSSVAVSANGNILIIGGYGDDGYVGAAWMFERINGLWTQQGNKLVGTGYIGASSEGEAVAISADGNTAIIGGSGDNGQVGASWIFTRNNGSWAQQGNKLVGSAVSAGSQGGVSVAINADGNTAIVGESSDRAAGWVFTRNNGIWSEQGGKLLGTGSVGGPQQGGAVAISADGNTAIIGALSNIGVSGIIAAWVTTRTNGTWSQNPIEITGMGYVGSVVWYGSSVAISADGNTAIVGGWGDDDEVGAAWVF